MEDLDEIREFFAKDRFATENGAVIAFAVASNHEKLGTVSLNANITFLRASKGDKLIATAECVRDGRTTCYYRVSVTDNTGALIAEITTSGYKTS